MWRSRRQADDEFCTFVAQNRVSLERTAWLLTGHRERAADLLQHALVKTYMAWSRVRHREAAAYCRKVMANDAIDEHRRRREVATDMATPAYQRVGDDGQSSRVEDRDQLVRLLDRLPARQRTVIVLRYFEDLTEQGIADELGISVGSVKSAASRGMATLRSLAASTLASSSTPHLSLMQGELS